MRQGHEDIGELWILTFRSLWRRIARDARLVRTPPTPEIILSNRLAAYRCAQIEWGNFARIVISARYAAQLRSELREHQQALVTLASLPYRPTRRHPDRILKVIEQLVVSFVLLHEIFHLMSGHVGLISSGANAQSFDEFSIGMFSAEDRGEKQTDPPSERKMAEAYFLESEADCCALQWIIQMAMPMSLSRHLGQPVPDFSSLAAVQRIVGFRMVLTAAWMTLRRMELNRARWMGRASETHPLPGARLFLAIGTLLQEYSEISELRFDRQGGGHHTLTGSDITTITTFLHEILSPVLTADWNPDEDVVKRGSLEALMVTAFPDFANHMLNRRPQTPVGREVSRMERVRLRIYPRLARHRYFPVIQINPPV